LSEFSGEEPKTAYVPSLIEKFNLWPVRVKKGSDKVGWIAKEG
jgi:hypothetical protein